MAIINLTEENFNETAEQNPILVIDFWAPWCGPCRQFAPIFEEVAAQHTDIAFAKVNTEEQQGIAGYFQIQSIPTVMIIREGVIVFAEPGMLPKEALEDIINQVKALDMDEVRAQIAKEQANNPQ